MHVAAVDALEAMHLQLGVVLARGLAVSSLLPVVAILAVLDSTSVVQKHRPTRGSVQNQGSDDIIMDHILSATFCSKKTPNLMTVEVVCQASC